MSEMFRHGQAKQDWKNIRWKPALPLFRVSMQVHTRKKQRGYAPEMRKRAVQLYVDGTNLRHIARQLQSTA